MFPAGALFGVQLNEQNDKVIRDTIRATIQKYFGRPRPERSRSVRSAFARMPPFSAYGCCGNSRRCSKRMWSLIDDIRP
jgi:hypothetical protein